MNHFELVLKIKDMALDYVLCVCVTAKGFETNSFFFSFFIYLWIAVTMQGNSLSGPTHVFQGT